MSCCPVAARAPVVVRAQAGARQEGGNQKKMMASAALHGVVTAVRRGWSSSRARGVTVAALSSASAGRPAAVLPSVVSSRGAAAWGAAKDNRGYASNVFQSKNRLVLNKAVAEPSSSEAEVVEEEEPIKLLTSDESEELLKIRHTTAHICAMATQKLFPDAQCTIGPWCVDAA